MIYDIRRSVGLSELKQLTNEDIGNNKELIKDYIDINDLYSVDNFLHSILYINKNNGNILPLDTVLMAEDILEKRNSYIDELIKEKRFENVILLCDGQLGLMCYEIIEHLIPLEYKYDCFMRAYSRADFNFEGASENIDVDAILELKRLDDDKREKLKDICEEDFLTIYRGQGSRSTSLEKAISWTTDIAVAKRFAKEFNFSGDGVIYAAEVYLDDITDYIDGSEKEIIVNHYYLHNVRLFDDLK